MKANARQIFNIDVLYKNNLHSPLVNKGVWRFIFMCDLILTTNY